MIGVLLTLNDCIIVKYDPFAMESRVSIYSQQKEQDMQVSSTISELTNAVISLAYSNQCYEVKIHAPASITEEIQREVQECEQQIYSTNKIQIEGI